MEYKIESNFNDVRLDRFLRKKYDKVPLTEIFKGIRTGKIKVNGKKAKENYRLKSGDIVKVLFQEIDKTIPQKIINISDEEFLMLKKGIIYEDQNIVIFNKKSNIVMHKGSGHDYGLSEMFKNYYKTEEFNFVNRIDKATSGLIIGAKNLATTRELAKEIRDGKTLKKYYILVDGIVEKSEFNMKSYLRKDETKVVELEEYEIGAKESISYFKVIKRGKTKTLLEGTLETGRTHQLRVQLSGMKHPIVGDAKYGNKGKKLYLFSYFCEIEKYGIKVELDIPEDFLKLV